MPLALLKYALGMGSRERHFPAPQPLKKRYEVLVIGAGGHGLACAYHLAKDHAIKNVAVIDKGYLGGGNTARNTTIVRANYLTEEGTAFYKESLRLFENLSSELDLNTMYSKRGHLTLAHTDAALRTARWRAEVNKHLGVRSEVVGRAELRKLCPQMNLSDEVRFPVLGALYHAPGAIARHDAVAWGYARAAHRRGVAIFPNTEATGIVVEKGRVVAVKTSRGTIAANKVVQAVAGHSSLLANKVGIRLPIRTVPLQACVSQPYQPFLDPIVVSGSLHVYISQSARGEFVMGGGDRPLRALQHALDAGVQGAAHDAYPRTLSATGGRKPPATMGRARRHDTRLLARDGKDADQELLHRRRMGHLGLQGDPRLRQAHGAMYRFEQDTRLAETLRSVAF